MKKIFTSTLFLLFISFNISAQMSNGKFGNEWINFDQSYFKIMVAEDGVYRIPYQSMVDAGVPVNSLTAGQFQLFHLGEEVPVYISGSGNLGNTDYIEFFGQQNRSELDRFLFEAPDAQMLNPAYSLFTDTTAYFLTWTTSNGQRFDNINNDLSNPPAKESFFFFEQSINLHSNHIKRRESSDGVAYSDYNDAEGFSSGFKKTQTINLTPQHAGDGQITSTLKVRFATNTNAVRSHQQIISLNGTELFNEDLGEYEVKELSFDVSTSEIANSAEVKFEGVADNNDKQAVSIVSLTYPRTFDFDDVKMAQFTIDASSSKKYLEIENFNAEGSDPILYDVTNNQRIVATLDGDLIKVVLPASSMPRDLILVNSVSGFKNTTPTSINFIDYSEQEAEFVIISNNRLFNDGQGNNQIQAYANYRSSTIGGGYSTMIVDVQQLYDQFSYGIHRHPFSVKNFAQQIHRDWSDVKYVFIIGKGREYHNVRSTNQYNGARSTYYVPTYGYPGADNLLLSAQGKNYPSIPFGRIAVSDAKDVRIYLDKVKALEENQRNAPQTIEGRGWMKEVLHLGGGGSGERDVIKSSLEAMADIIENNQFGGNVTSVYKTSSDPVQISQSEQIFGTINRGVSMITFFGHSGVGTFDFDIDNPENYENYGKYPLMFSLGCYSGNIHTNSRGVSERFVYYEDKGAIAFGATTGLGFVSALNRVNSKWYDAAGGDLYGQGIGDIFKSTLTNFDNFTDYPTRTLVQQFTLQGDPAVKLNPAPGPDYLIDVSSFKLDPTIVDLEKDKFTLNMDIVNIGRQLGDSIYIKVTQELPTGQQFEVKRERILASTYTTSLTLEIPTLGEEALGLNKLFVSIDANNDVEELPDPAAEQNNEYTSSLGVQGFDFFVVSNGLTPLYPPKFGIVNTPQVTLKSTTGDALAPSKKYVLEMDTTTLFNSPIKQREEIIQSGGVIKWSPSISLVENQEYYWRVSPDSIDANIGFIWENSSFIYLPNTTGEGWNQSDYYQYQDNFYDDVELPSSTREFEFITNFKDVRIDNKVFVSSQDRPRYFNNGTEWAAIFEWTINSGIQVTVLDTLTKYWKNPGGPGLHGSINGTSQQLLTFPFPTNTSEERAVLINFLENVIPDNYYVLLYSVQRNANESYHPEDWDQDPTSLFNLLEDQGATQVRNLEQTGSVPYIFFYQKGVGPLEEKIADTVSSQAQVQYSFPGAWKEGTVESSLIGPAKSWESFEWLLGEVPLPQNDSSSISIRGINQNLGIDTLLYEGIQDLSFSLANIDAMAFPYLKLEYYAFDKVNRTPPPLDYWRVLYQGIPEIAINANEHFEVYNDTIQQGDVFRLGYAIENISNHDIDSLLVKYSFKNQDNNETVLLQRTAPIAKNQIIQPNISLSTADFTGIQTITVEANANKEQLEQFHPNNFLFKKIFVDNDRINPILDVTFDGVHIMNGDLVSPTPLISISLRDENKFFELNDTSLFKVFLQYPDDELGTAVLLDSDEINFIPSANTGRNNIARIEFSPELLQDGLYELLVQAQDFSGNQSGETDYKVSFEIITKQMISNVLNYPNPFSTSTQFVYTLTGATTPDYFKIQIMTVSGKIVREITQDELGPLKIGTHRTEYKWDGTDEYGGRLANGVYLYRIVVKDAMGADYEKYDTGTNQFFQNDFGKMVIMR